MRDAEEFCKELSASLLMSEDRAVNTNCLTVFGIQDAICGI